MTLCTIPFFFIELLNKKKMNVILMLNGCLKIYYFLLVNILNTILYFLNLFLTLVY